MIRREMSHSVALACGAQSGASHHGQSPGLAWDFSLSVPACRTPERNIKRKLETTFFEKLKANYGVIVAFCWVFFFLFQIIYSYLRAFI